MIRFLFVLAASIGFVFGGQLQAQDILKVEGAVATPLTLSKADLEKLPVLSLRAKDHDGNERVYTGVAFVDILKKAGVTLGSQLRGEKLAQYILIAAADGYRVIFALPEFDPEFVDQTILLAYAVDGKPLPEGEGPLRLVVPGEKKHARWIRQVVSVKISFVK